MRIGVIFKATFALALSISPAAGQEAARIESGGSLFAEAKATPEVLPLSFEFEMPGHRYLVKNNGAGRRVKENQTRLFNLRLDGRDFIETIYFAEYQSNVILVCAVSDGDGAAGFVVRLEQPSMRARWKRALPSFNITLPVRDGADLFVAGHGFVARLDLAAGEYVWKHEGLYGRGGEGAFASFAPPEVAGEEVLFRETTVYNRPVRTIRVERRTGRIVRIE